MRTIAKTPHTAHEGGKILEGVVLAFVVLAACILLASCGTSSSSLNAAISANQLVADDIMASSADKASPTDVAGDDVEKGVVVDNFAMTSTPKPTPRAIPTTTGTTTQVAHLADQGCFETDTTSMNFDFTDQELNGLGADTSTLITLNGNAATIKGAGASFENNSMVCITAGGVYTLTGTLDNGVVLVCAPGDDVQLILHDLTITNGENPVLHIQAANQAIITLDGTVVLGDGSLQAAANDEGTADAAEEPAAEGADSAAGETESATEATDPTASDATEATDSAALDATEATDSATSDATGMADEVNPATAVITSDADLAINGTGSLTIASAKDGGVYCAGTLALVNGNYDITVPENGFYAVDAIKVADGTYRVHAGEQAFTAINLDDFNRGYAAFEGGTFDVTADEFVETSSFLAITDGTYQLLCTEDAIASNIDMYIGGGQFGIITNGYGFNAETDFVTEGGDIVDFYGLDTYTADTLYATPSSLASDTTYDNPINEIAEYGYCAE